MSLGVGAAAAVLAASAALAEPGPGGPADCGALLEEKPAARGTARCYYELAVREESSDLAQRAVDRLVERSSELPWFGYYLANLRWAEQPDLAQELYGEVAKRFRRVGVLEGEVFARINRSQLLQRLGRDREAQEEIGRVFDLTEGSTDPELRAWGRLTLARELKRSGEDLDRAYRLLSGIEIPRTADGWVSLEKHRLGLLANLGVEIGRLREASSAYRQLLALALETGDLYLEANARYGQALVSLAGLVESPTSRTAARTRRLARRAMKVASEAEHRTVEARAARILGSLSPGEHGRHLLEHCREIAPSPSLESYCLNALGRRLLQDDPARALRLIEESLALAREAGDGWAQLQAWPEMMRARWATVGAEEALRDSWTALSKIEEIRDRQTVGSGVQAGFFSLWSDDYAWVAGRLLETAERKPEGEWAVAEAFRVSERMRARTLIDWLRESGAQPGGAAEAGFTSVVEVQRALDAGEALLSFQVAPWEDYIGGFGGGSWVTVVTRDGVSFHRLPGRSEVRRAVSLFEGLFEARRGAEAGPATALYERLLAPALDGLPEGLERLILVPDDALHRLPFAALRAAPEAPPLGARFELVRVPSATLWLRWRGEAPEPAERPLLVLADPELEGVEGIGADDEVQVATVRGAAPPADAYGRLPHARREGRRAVRALRGGELLAGAEASEAALVSSDLRSFGLLHFAAHAVTDEDRPERSAILLAAGGGEDGRLESSEIAGLDLVGRTAVLASCRSADGTVLRGEGVMSLARAFFQAGTHSVVASLWPLRDDEGERLFEAFYRHLAAGETLSSALRLARRNLILAGEPAAAWAGVVLLGEGTASPVDVPVAGGEEPPLRWAWLLVAAAGAVAALAGVLVSLRRRRAGQNAPAVRQSTR